MSKKKRKNSNYKQNASSATAPAARVGATSTKSGARPLPIIICSVIALIIISVIVLVSLNACYGGECYYAKNRDVSDREVVYVEMSIKDYGRVTLLLDKTTAPITVDNFVSLVNDGFYDGLTFHRIIENFMIQGGDPEGTGSGGSENEIKGEFSANGHVNDIQHLEGVISMARTTPYDSASSQFFICNADSPHLNGQYAAFGYVVKGLNVIHRVTEDFVDKTVGGVIRDKSQQPIIEYIRVID